jgi:hypothetical protein
MRYILRSRTTGGRYLVRRETGKKFYRWAKRGRRDAFKFTSYDAARKAAVRYEGVIDAIR